MPTPATYPRQETTVRTTIPSYLVDDSGPLRHFSSHYHILAIFYPSNSQFLADFLQFLQILSFQSQQFWLTVLIFPGLGSSNSMQVLTILVLMVTL